MHDELMEQNSIYSNHLNSLFHHEPHGDDVMSDHLHSMHGFSSMPSLSQGTMTVGRRRPRFRKILMETALEIVLLLGNIMVQRGIWEGLDDRDVPSYISGLVGLASFILSICFNNCLNTDKEETRIFTPRRYFMSALLLLCSVNVWRSLWNLQNELNIPWLNTTVAGTLVIISGMMLEQCLARRRARDDDALHGAGPHPPFPGPAGHTAADAGSARHSLDAFSHDPAVLESLEHAGLVPPGEEPEPPLLAEEEEEETKNPVAELICKIRNR